MGVQYLRLLAMPKGREVAFVIGKATSTVSGMWDEI